MSIFKKKDKPKDKDGSNGDLKTSKSKKHKAKDIWQACEMGYLESLDKMLKKKNGMAMLNMPNEEGHAPIHIAAGAGHIAIVEALLAAGAHCNMIEGAEPRWNVLHWAVSSRNFAMMKLILSQPSIKPDFRGPTTGTSHMDRNTALHYFCRYFEEDPEGIINLIMEKGGNVNAPNSQGETPLHIACLEKHVTLAKLLLAKGANPNSQNDHGETPLHLGARYGPEAMVKVLLKAGGNKTTVGAHGTPYEVAYSQALKKLLAPGPTSSSSSSTPATSSVTSSRETVLGASTSTSSTSATAPQDASHQTTTTESSSAPSVPSTPSIPNKQFHWAVDWSEINLGPQIGSGGFGVVYKGGWRGIDVAVKCLRKDVDMDDDVLTGFLHEVNVMSKLRHQNILLFVGACLQEPNLCFLTEFIPHGNLRHVLNKERLQPLKKINMAVEMTRGLTYLHSQQPAVLHRDLKSANILVDDNYHIKLADFGLSRPALGTPRSMLSMKASITANLSKVSTTSSAPPICSSEQSRNGNQHQASETSSAPGAATDISTSPKDGPSGYVSTSSPASAPACFSKHAEQGGYLSLIEQAGTLYTTAPEVLHGREYTKEADVYALGIIFWELATDKMPYEGMTPLQLVRAIDEANLPIPTEMGPLFGELVREMLSKDPTMRPTLPDIAERLKAVRTQIGQLFR